MKQYLVRRVNMETLERAEQAIRANGGRVFTDNTFEIQGVKGSYKQDGNDLIITITDKPWLASWGMIEEQISKFFC